MRAIDADELKIRLRVPCQKCTFNGTKFCKACEVNEFIDYIDSAPTVDKRPPGKWINKFIGGNECVMCSECELHFDIGTNFCPNCGADMKGDNNG